MTRITNVDQVLLLLQARLQRLETSKSKKASPVEATTPSEKKDPLIRLRSIASDKALSQEDVRRALIGSILSTEFGAELSNDAGFQQVIDDVVAIMSRDERSKRILDDAIRQLVDKA